MEKLCVEELALQRKRYAHLTDEEFRFMLQQVDGRQRTREKLPIFAKIEDWWYPVRLSCEQCSSELTARYKAEQTTRSGEYSILVDLTGGYGVDTYFMSEYVEEAHYVERNEELCRIVRHNFEKTRPYVEIHNSTAEEFLSSFEKLEKSLVFIDPARRDSHGGKVFRIEDCEPNIKELLPILKQAKSVVIKLSPMLDITAALRSLDMPFDVHIVAVKNEVKEVLLIGSKHSSKTHTINILADLKPETDTNQIFDFTMEEEAESKCAIYSNSYGLMANAGNYIYEPNAAILKAGAYKLVGERYGLCKMSPNTHLYLSDKLIDKFPGRVWQIVTINAKDYKNTKASVMTRNYPMTSEQLRKKLKTKEDDSYTIIGARLAEKPTLFLCKKI